MKKIIDLLNYQEREEKLQQNYLSAYEEMKIASSHGKIKFHIIKVIAALSIAINGATMAHYNRNNIKKRIWHLTVFMITSGISIKNVIEFIRSLESHQELLDSIENGSEDVFNMMNDEYDEDYSRNLINK